MSMGLINAKQLAEKLEVTPRVVGRMHAADRMPDPAGCSTKRKRWWRSEDIEAWWAAGCPNKDDWKKLLEKKLLSTKRKRR